MKQFTTIVEVLRRIRASYSNPKALNVIEKGVWKSHSTEEMLQEIKHIALGLIALGLKRGDSVGILAYSSSYWTIVDCAIMVAGGVTVPLFANIADENFLFEVTQSDTKILFVSGKEQWNMFSRHQDLFDTIVTIDDDSHGVGLTYKEILSLGQKVEEKQPTLYDSLEDAVKPDDLATIIYTSGSTGVPKGAELTQQNLVGFFHLDEFGWKGDTDIYLSILPLAHVFGRSLNLFLITWGVSVYYSNDVKNLGHVCREIHPTILVVVPRLLEKVYAKMLANVQQAGSMKRTLGLWAFELANMEEDSLFKTMLHPLVDKIVYSALRNALGGGIRVVISGGAPLNPHLCHFFIEIGVPIYEGWGLTEASTVSCNLPGQRKIGTVGKPLGNMEVKVSEEGELLVRGPIVLKKYYKNPQVSAQAIDKEGFFHTGDKGSIDEEGYVRILGRLKELYKTSTGEYIAPVPIEQALCKAALIDMALVVGQGRKFASCLLFPDLDVLHSLKAAQNAEQQTDEEFLNSEFVKIEMGNLIRNINQHLNSWEQIHAYRFVLYPLTIESGELTPSMKIRREIVTQKYNDLIDEMYAEEKDYDRASRNH